MQVQLEFFFLCSITLKPINGNFCLLFHSHSSQSTLNLNILKNFISLKTLYFVIHRLFQIIFSYVEFTRYLGMGISFSRTRKQILSVLYCAGIYQGYNMPLFRNIANLHSGVYDISSIFNFPTSIVATLNAETFQVGSHAGLFGK